MTDNKVLPVWGLGGLLDKDSQINQEDLLRVHKAFLKGAGKLWLNANGMSDQDSRAVINKELAKTSQRQNATWSRLVEEHGLHKKEQVSLTTLLEIRLAKELDKLHSKSK